MGFLGGLLGANNDFKVDQSKFVNPANLGSNFGQAYGQGQDALAKQMAFAQALQAQGGIGNQSNVFAQQQALANQLGQQAQGQGPNPALAQLAQTTGQNAQNQAALMASQRGAGANAGLLARQAAMQGGALQQQATGQAAIMRAQQQLAAQQQLQNQQAQMAQLAGQQVGQQAGALSGANQFAQGQQGLAQSAINSQNQNQLGINQINAGVAAGNQQAQNGIIGGLLGGAGTVLGASMMPQAKAKGGMIDGPSSSIAQRICGMKEGGSVPGKAKVHGDSYSNDTVPAMLSPGEVVIPRHVMQGDDPVKGAAEFVKQVMSKKKVDPKSNFYKGGMEVGVEEAPQEAPDLSLKDPVKESKNPLPDWLTTTMTGRPDASQMTPQELAIATGANIIGAGPTLAATDAIKKQLDVTDKAEEDAINAKYAANPAQGAELQMQQGAGQAPSIPSPSPGLGQMPGSDQYQKGLKLEAGVQGGLGEQEADIAHEQMGQIEQANKDYQEQLKPIQERRQALMADYANGHVDANRLFHNMGTGQKIATSIGLILGGIGSGLTHQENAAAKYLNQAIENDVRSQEIDLGKKKSMLDDNLREMGNLRDARIMTIANARDIAGLKMQEAIANAKDPMAKARLQQELGKWQMQTDQITRPLQIKEQIQGAVKQGANPALLLNTIPAHDQAKAREEAAKAADLAHKRIQVLKAWDMVNKVQTPGYALAHPQRAFSGAQESQLNAAIAELNKELTGRFNPEENKKLMEQFKPGKTDSPEDRALRRKQLEDYASPRVSYPTLEQYQIDPKLFQENAMGIDRQKLNNIKAWAMDPANKNNPKWAAARQQLGIK